MVPQPPQLLLSLLVSAQLLPHLVGAVAGQSETQVCWPPTVEHSGFAPPQAVPQAPQWESVFSADSQSGLVLSQFP